ncbi:MAG: hypothetical protein LBJ92_02320 [Holosporales bacterium]|jgi:hypothetical protein|nr:hypothetical protein [Holosporales bacterium]
MRSVKWLLITVLLVIEFQSVDASVDTTVALRAANLNVTEVRKKSDCPEWMRPGGCLGNGELSEFSIMVINNIFQQQSASYMSEPIIYTGNLTAGNYNWVAINYAIRGLYLQSQEYYDKYAVHQIIDEISEKAVAKTKLYYNLSDQLTVNTLYDVKAYLSGLQFPGLMKKFKKDYEPVNKLIDEESQWQKPWSSSNSTTQLLARSFKRISGDGSTELMVTQAQKLGTREVPAKQTEWHNNISKAADDIFGSSKQTTDSIIQEFGKYTTEEQMKSTLLSKIKTILYPPLPAPKPVETKAPEPVKEDPPAPKPVETKAPDPVKEDPPKEKPVETKATEPVKEDPPEEKPVETKAPEPVKEDPPEEKPEEIKDPEEIHEEVPESSVSSDDESQKANRIAQNRERFRDWVKANSEKWTPISADQLQLSGFDKIPDDLLEFEIFDDDKAIGIMDELQKKHQDLVPFFYANTVIPDQSNRLTQSLCSAAKRLISAKDIVSEGSKERVLEDSAWGDTLQEILDKQEYTLQKQLDIKSICRDISYTLALRMFMKVVPNHANITISKWCNTVIPIPVSSMVRLLMSERKQAATDAKSLKEYIIQETGRILERVKAEGEVEYTKDDILIAFPTQIREIKKKFGYSPRDSVIIQGAIRFDKKIDEISMYEVKQKLKEVIMPKDTGTTRS